MPHLIIWKDKSNYFIYPELVNWLKHYSLSKRFYYIKLSIIASNKIQGNIRHANLILVDNLKKCDKNRNAFSINELQSHTIVLLLPASIKMKLTVGYFVRSCLLYF